MVPVPYLPYVPYLDMVILVACRMMVLMIVTADVFWIICSDTSGFCHNLVLLPPSLPPPPLCLLLPPSRPEVDDPSPTPSLAHLS
jgi:hypothetical protein